MTTPKVRALQIVYDQLVNGEPADTPQAKLAHAIAAREREELRQWLSGFDAVALSDIHYAMCQGRDLDEIRREFEPRRRRTPSNDPGAQ